jgi:hypothetical protein
MEARVVGIRAGHYLPFSFPTLRQREEMSLWGMASALPPSFRSAPLTAIGAQITPSMDARY